MRLRVLAVAFIRHIPVAFQFTDTPPTITSLRSFTRSAAKGRLRFRDLMETRVRTKLAARSQKSFSKVSNNQLARCLLRLTSL
jgi:hypothetical protein